MKIITIILPIVENHLCLQCPKEHQSEFHHLLPHLCLVPRQDLHLLLLLRFINKILLFRHHHYHHPNLHSHKDLLLLPFLLVNNNRIEWIRIPIVVVVEEKNRLFLLSFILHLDLLLLHLLRQKIKIQQLLYLLVLLLIEEMFHHRQNNNNNNRHAQDFLLLHHHRNNNNNKFLLLGHL